MLLLSFLSLGRFIYAPDTPRKSDIIVSLGGGDGRRIKEAVQLYQKGYSRSGKFLYTGREIVNPDLPDHFSKSTFLKEHGISPENIIYIPRGVIVNTAEELFFLRDFMKKHRYKSALIISSPVHTRRIRMLAEYIAGFNQNGLSLTVSSYSPEEFNPWLYFLDQHARGMVFLEFEKLVYNLLKYSPLTIDKTSYMKKRETPLWQNALSYTK